MGCETPQEFPARFRIVDAQEHMCAEVRRWPGPQHGRLYFVQLECRRTRRTILPADSLTDSMGASFHGSGSIPRIRLTIGRYG